MSVTDDRDAADATCREGELLEAIEVVVKGQPRPLGNLDVTRLLPSVRRRNVGPFVFLDHMGPVRLPPGQGFDVRPHPHIGLSTVTYLLEGEMVHRDSLGSVQSIEPGAINLMTAGRGIVHSERSSAAARARGAAVHGLQLWLALPLDAEDGPPAFQHHEATALPSFRASPADGDASEGVAVRVLLGRALGRTSPATDPSSPVLLDLAMPDGATFDLPVEIEECAVYVVEGELAVGGCAFGERELIVRRAGFPLAVIASRATRAFVLGGPPLDQRRFMDWNFVSSSRERIDRARADWRAQTFPKIPGDDAEFVPLP